MRILLIDTSSVLHAAKYGISNPLKHKDKDKFIIYGFLLKLQMLMRNVNPTLTVFANDTRLKDSFRKKIYPAYKEKRHENKTPEDIKLEELVYPQFEIVKEYIIPSLGFRNNYSEKGLEADDIIGSVCKSYCTDEIVIVTTDKDMYQLLSSTTCIYNPQKNRYYTLKDFRNEYDIEPKMWKRVKAISGCASDNVTGVPGVGEKGVLQYLKGRLPMHYKKYQDIESRTGKDIINRNKKLVILPHRRTPKYKLKPDHVNKKALLKIAKEFKFKSIEKSINNWAKVLKAY